MLRFLQDLRVALIRWGICVLIFSVCGWLTAESFLGYLVRISGVELAAYGLADTFLALVTLSLGIGCLASIPYFLYLLLHLVANQSAGFDPKQLFGFWIAAVALFGSGVAFCLNLTLPYGIAFLLNFATDQIQALISVRHFVSFCLLLIFGFGFVFELPLAMLVLARTGLVSRDSLVAYRRYAVIGFAVFSAVLTPTPDLLNMALMAVPLYLLYEVGILAMRLWPPAGPACRPIRKARGRL